MSRTFENENGLGALRVYVPDRAVVECAFPIAIHSPTANPG